MAWLEWKQSGGDTSAWARGFGEGNVCMGTGKRPGRSAWPEGGLGGGATAAGSRKEVRRLFSVMKQTNGEGGKAGKVREHDMTRISRLGAHRRRRLDEDGDLAGNEKDDEF